MPPGIFSLMQVSFSISLPARYIDPLYSLQRYLVDSPLAHAPNDMTAVTNGRHARSFLCGNLPLSPLASLPRAAGRTTGAEFSFNLEGEEELRQQPELTEAFRFMDTVRVKVSRCGAPKICLLYDV